MTDYKPAEIVNAVASGTSWFTKMVEKENGFVDAILLRNIPVVITKVASEAGDYHDAPPDGQDVFLVVKVGTQYFKKTGYYTSYSGTSWNAAVREVHPVTKTITVFE